MTFSQILIALARRKSFYLLLTAYALMALIFGPLVEKSAFYLAIPVAIMAVSITAYIDSTLRKKRSSDDRANR
jgi:hypothetical protein